MRKLFLPLLAVSVLIACNSNSSSKETKADKATDNTSNPDYQKGLDLVAKNKCMTCHAIDQTITGPPYREVAKRYANRPDTIVQYLAHKVINGGNGNWGELYMTPNVGVSQEDAEAMVKYILLLNK